MQIKNKKRFLLTVFFIILITLILIIAWASNRNKPYNPSDSNFKKNYGVVYNQGSEILSYNNYTYLLNNSNSIIKYNEKDGTGKSFLRLQNSVADDRMFIMSNNLIYSDGKKTYYTNVDTPQVKDFCNGKVVYINEDVYLYIVEQNLLQYLYITSYDGETFYRTNTVFYNLAKGNEINFLKEINNVLFFTSKNSDGSATLFSVDLNNYKTTLIARSTNGNATVDRVEISDVAMDEEYIYYIIVDVHKTTYDEFYSDYTIYVKNIGGSFAEYEASDVEPKFGKDPKDDSNVLYMSYNFENKEYEWNKGLYEPEEFKLLDLMYGDVKKYISLQSSAIYALEDKITDIDSKYVNYSLKEAINTDGVFYFYLTSGNNGVWYSYNKADSELKIIYEY